MRSFPLIPLAALACACTTSALDETATINAADDAALGEALAGLSAREPVSCVRMADLRNSRGYGSRTVVLNGPPGTVYVNRTRSECPEIKPWHAIRHRTTGANVCNGDLIRVFDPQSGIEYGGCSLGEFTPYRRD